MEKDWSEEDVKVFDLVMSKVDDDAMILMEEGITLALKPYTQHTSSI